MASKFDYRAEQRILDGAVGVQYSLDLDFETIRLRHGLLGNAEGMFCLAVGSVLAGSQHEIRPLLVKARDWVTAAIDQGERPGDYFPNFQEADRLKTLFLCNWLLDGIQDENSLKKLIEYRRRYYVANPEFNNTKSFSYSAVEFLDATAYTDFLNLVSEAGNVAFPQKASQAKAEATVALVCALNKVEGRFSETDVQKALLRLLDRWMGEWLTTGRQLHAAHWLKYVYWAGGRGLSPTEALLKAYDHMPEAEKPPSI
jgi:hypothetical protein